MQFSNFKFLFDTSIRAWLNWEVLEELNVNAKGTVITDRVALGKLRTVWHVTSTGEAGDWRDPDSTPQTVAEAAVNAKSWDIERSRNIRRFHDQFASFREPMVITLPAYQVGDELLLLDGTHRAVAAYLAGVEIRLFVLALKGPISEAILPDLSKFTDRVEAELIH